MLSRLLIGYTLSQTPAKLQAGDIKSSRQTLVISRVPREAKKRTMGRAIPKRTAEQHAPHDAESKGKDFIFICACPPRGKQNPPEASNQPSAIPSGEDCV